MSEGLDRRIWPFDMANGVPINCGYFTGMQARWQGWLGGWRSLQSVPERRTGLAAAAVQPAVPAVCQPAARPAAPTRTQECSNSESWPGLWQVPVWHMRDNEGGVYSMDYE